MVFRIYNVWLSSIPRNLIKLRELRNNEFAFLVFKLPDVTNKIVNNY